MKVFLLFVRLSLVLLLLYDELYFNAHNTADTSNNRQWVSSDDTAG